MILSFSVRDNHPIDRKIIEWYKSLAKSDRSRLIRDIILDYIEGSKQAEPTIVEKETVAPKKLDIQPVKLTKQKTVDLDSKINNMF